MDNLVKRQTEYLYDVVDDPVSDVLAADIARSRTYAEAALQLPPIEIVMVVPSEGASDAERVVISRPDVMGYVDRMHPGRIYLHPSPAAPFVVLHEARHVWQHREWLQPAPLLVDVYKALETELAESEADANVWGMEAALTLYTPQTIRDWLLAYRAAATLAPPAQNHEATP